MRTPDGFEMPVTGKDASDAMLNDKVVFGCASCEHYHAAKNKGLPDCGKPLCGSPLVGKTFPEYSGPMTEMRYVCWVCGDDAKVGLHFIGAQRTLGACNEHKNVHQSEFNQNDVLLITE